MKTEVYSWRVSRELKMDLEREARRRKVPVASLLDEAAREWLVRSNEQGADAQEKLHRAAEDCLGAFAGGNAGRSENAGRAVRDRLRRKRAG